MKKNGIITYTILGLFHLILFAVSFYIDYLTKKQDLGSLFTISKYAFVFKYISFIGLGVIIYNFIISSSTIKAYKQENDKLNQDMSALKAKLFDLQEAAKK